MEEEDKAHNKFTELITKNIAMTLHIENWNLNSHCNIKEFGKPLDPRESSLYLGCQQITSFISTGAWDITRQHILLLIWEQ